MHLLPFILVTLHPLKCVAFMFAPSVVCLKSVGGALYPQEHAMFSVEILG